MFNYIMSDKSVTYKTEILCSYWLSGRTGRKIIGLGVMIYGPMNEKVFEFPQVISKTVSSVSIIKKRDQN